MEPDASHSSPPPKRPKTQHLPTPLTLADPASSNVPQPYPATSSSIINPQPIPFNPPQYPPSLAQTSPHSFPQLPLPQSPLHPMVTNTSLPSTPLPHHSSSNPDSQQPPVHLTPSFPLPSTPPSFLTDPVVPYHTAVKTQEQTSNTPTHPQHYVPFNSSLASIPSEITSSTQIHTSTSTSRNDQQLSDSLQSLSLQLAPSSNCSPPSLIFVAEDGRGDVEEEEDDEEEDSDNEGDEEEAEAESAAARNLVDYIKKGSTLLLTNFPLYFITPPKSFEQLSHLTHSLAIISPPASPYTNKHW